MSAERPYDAERSALPAGIAVFLYGRFFSALLQVGTLALLANLLDKSGLAYVSFILVVVTTATALGSLGIGDSVFYLVGRAEDQGARVVRQATFLLVLAAVPVVILVALLVFLTNPAVDVRDVFPWLALTIALELPTQPAVNLLVTLQEPKRASAVYTAFSAASLAAVLVPVLLDLPIHAVVYALAGIGIVKGLVYVAIVRRYFPGPVAWYDKAALRGVASYAIPIGLTSLAGVLNKQIDKLVVGFLLTDAMFAEFAVGAFELPLITLIPYAVSTLQQPLYVKLMRDGHYADLRELWNHAIEKTALVVLPCAAFLILHAEDIIALVFSERYLPAALPFQLFTGVLFLRVAAYGPLVRAQGDARPLVRLAFLLVLVNVALSLPLTSVFGPPGAAAATLTANWVVFLLTLPLLSRALQAPIRDVMPWRRLGLVLLLALGATLATWLVTSRFDGLGRGAHLGLGGAVFTAVFVPLGFMTKVLGGGDLAYLWSFLTLGPLRARRR